MTKVLSFARQIHHKKNDTEIGRIHKIIEGFELGNALCAKCNAKIQKHEVGIDLHSRQVLFRIICHASLESFDIDFDTLKLPATIFALSNTKFFNDEPPLPRAS